MNTHKNATFFDDELFESSLLTVNMTHYPKICHCFFLGNWEIIDTHRYANYTLKKLTFFDVIKCHMDSPSVANHLLGLESGHLIWQKPKTGEKGYYHGALQFGLNSKIEIICQDYDFGDINEQDK
ncbi:MAG: hypothetical protein Q3971_07325 [Moraxella sp.]|nr:hypothetical protein [Moraxella sp.]